MNGNQVVDISPLSGLIHLEELELSKNKIGNIAPLTGLVNLKELSLNNNRISDISGLQNLKLSWFSVTNQIIYLQNFKEVEIYDRAGNSVKLIPTNPQLPKAEQKEIELYTFKAFDDNFNGKVRLSLV